MENHTSGNENQVYSANRRKFIKNVGVTGASLTMGVAGLSGTSRAETAEPDPKVDSSTQTRSLGSHYYYDERYLDSGSSIERIDSEYAAGRWHYYFRTEACCSVADYKKDTGETRSAGIITGDEGFKIEELDAPDKVSTSIYGNSDWGIGVHGPDKKSYSWDEATVDTLGAIINYFSQVGGAVSTASDIVDYWQHASDPQTPDSATVKDNWDYWGPYSTDSKTAKLSHYLEFEQSFPPEEEFKKDYVDSWVTNNLNHNLTDFDNYSRTWGVTIAVLPKPSSASTSEIDKYGIEKIPASESKVAAADDISLDPNDPVYVAKNPPVEITKVGNDVNS